MYVPKRMFQTDFGLTGDTLSENNNTSLRFIKKRGRLQRDPLAESKDLSIFEHYRHIYYSEGLRLLGLRVNKPKS
jgi:hypothetical protein